MVTPTIAATAVTTAAVATAVIVAAAIAIPAVAAAAALAVAALAAAARGISASAARSPAHDDNSRCARYARRALCLHYPVPPSASVLRAWMPRAAACKS